MWTALRVADTWSVPSKRAIAKAAAAQLVDIESRLAPFFPPVATLPARSIEAPDYENVTPGWTPPLR